MSAFARAFAAELAHLSRDRWDQALLVLMPLFLLGITAAMVIAGVPRELPVAIVGGGDDALSRSFVTALDDAPAVRVVARPASEADALSLVRQGRIIAFLELPPNLDLRDRPTLRISFNASFLSTGGVAEAGMAQALWGAAETAALETTGLRGASALRLERPPISVAIIANPQASFEWYLQALIDPAVLHLLVACATAMAMGRALRGGGLGEWIGATGGAGAIPGKLAPYVLVATFWAAAWLIWIAGVRGWQPGGSLWLILLGQAVLFAATAAISALLVAATRETSTALAASAVYAGSALAYSGGSLPVEGGSLFAQGWSCLLPFTHYLTLQMDQWLGAPARLAWHQLAILALYVAIPGGLAAMLARRSA